MRVESSNLRSAPDWRGWSIPTQADRMRRYPCIAERSSLALRLAACSNSEVERRKRIAPRPESPEMRRAKGKALKRTWLSIKPCGTRRYSREQSAAQSDDQGVAESIIVMAPRRKIAMLPFWQ